MISCSLCPRPRWCDLSVDQRGPPLAMCEWSLGDSPTNPPRVRPQAFASSARARQPPRRTCNFCQAPRRINGQWLLPMRSRSAPWTIWASSAPDLPPVQPSEAPRPSPQQNKAARGTQSPPGLTHCPGWPGGHFPIGQQATPLISAQWALVLRRPLYTAIDRGHLVTPVPFVLVHGAALRNGNHSSR